MSTEIDHLDVTEVEAIQQHIAANRPCVIHCRPFQVKPEAALELLAEVKVAAYDTNDAVQATRKGDEFQQISVREFQDRFLDKSWSVAQNLEGDPACEAFQSMLYESLPGLETLTRRDDHESIFLWVSGQGKHVGLHYDCIDNFNLQLKGSKTFYIAPPGIRGYYTGSIISREYHVSSVMSLAQYQTDPEHRARYPEFARHVDQFIEVNLQPGDMLYLPNCWWHEVKTGAEEYAVNISWWFLSFKRAARFPMQGLASLYMYYYRRLFESHLV